MSQNVHEVRNLNCGVEKGKFMMLVSLQLMLSSQLTK